MNFGAALGRIVIVAVLLLPVLLPVGGPQSPAEAGPGREFGADATPRPEGSLRRRPRRVMVDLPKPPFAIDRRLLPHDRAVRAYGEPYLGPIIDIHLHLNTRRHRDTSLVELGGIAAGLRASGVERALVMPTPNEGRRRGHGKRRIHRKLLAEIGGKAIGLMCCGHYLGQWLHRAYYDTYTKESLDRLLARLAADLDSGLYAGVGEIALYHFDKNGRQAIIRYPPNFEPFLRVVELVASRGLWMLLHAESIDPKGVSYEDQVFGGIELLYRRHPDLKLIVAHTATTNSENLRRMLARYANLMIDFKLVKRLSNWHHTEPVNNPDRRLHEDWARLFEAMPRRFMVGTDSKFFRRRFDVAKYHRHIARYRKVLGGLNPRAARLIAYENAKRILSPGVNAK
jgi:acyl carrier protein phosphodiesterase